MTKTEREREREREEKEGGGGCSVTGATLIIKEGWGRQRSLLL